MLHLTTLTTLFLLTTTTTLALPSPLLPRADEPCAPTSYTLSSYTLTTSPTSAHVSFLFTSTFANPSLITDSAINGASCIADGAVIPNSNECAIEGRKLLFDLRGPQEEAYYQITHTWVCGG
ncbi:hypothetical protein NX059_004277 [Plenodomus lindquistii]|nr:hypothetical protein NX059_004277 [Plenodomus lindquistii]